jgi:hypothetical protein
MAPGRSPTFRFFFSSFSSPTGVLLDSSFSTDSLSVSLDDLSSVSLFAAVRSGAITGAWDRDNRRSRLTVGLF